MTKKSWLKIEYRDFYDVPRIFVVRSKGDTLLFDSVFDLDRDEYSDKYVVYRLSTEVSGKLNTLRDWRSLPQYGQHIATVNIGDVEFDPTKRAYIGDGVLSLIR